MQQQKPAQVEGSIQTPRRFHQSAQSKPLAAGRHPQRRAWAETPVRVALGAEAGGLMALPLRRTKLRRDGTCRSSKPNQSLGPSHPQNARAFKRQSIERLAILLAAFHYTTQASSEARPPCQSCGASLGGSPGGARPPFQSSVVYAVTDKVSRSLKRTRTGISKAALWPGPSSGGLGAGQRPARGEGSRGCDACSGLSALLSSNVLRASGASGSNAGVTCWGVRGAQVKGQRGSSAICTARGCVGR